MTAAVRRKEKLAESNAASVAVGAEVMRAVVVAGTTGDEAGTFEEEIARYVSASTTLVEEMEGNVKADAGTGGSEDTIPAAGGRVAAVAEAAAAVETMDAVAASTVGLLS